MNKDKRESRADNLIKDNLRRAFDDKASEELPTELIALLAQLRDQDDQNGTK
ncbi:NepR family anti-sigma factor [Yoonia maritima]|uniref:NepR family anti-sigma factor n=1 Tax=Yoonia maritima TaxID=1435347 RepID=UPI0013A644C9|nr:NepR family anti-sigma factor [Yoonia maritima]